MRWRFLLSIITILTVLIVLTRRDPDLWRTLSPLTPAHADVKSPPPRNLPSGKDLLRKTIQRLEGLTSISAKMDMKLFAEGQVFEGTGKYEELSQKESDSLGRERSACYRGTTLFRLHVSFPRLTTGEDLANREENVLDIVCDRNSLWTYTSVEGEKRLTEVNLSEMASVLQQAVEDEVEREEILANEMTLPTPLSGFPGLGGMAGALRRILVCYDFDEAAEPVAIKAKEGTIRAWRITGKMKPDYYNHLGESLLGDRPVEREELLDIIPSGVEIFVGQKDPFPYRIHYYAILNEQKEIRSDKMTIDFTDIYENHYSIRPENFVYVPGGITSTDETHSYLKKLIPGIEF